MKYVNFDEYRKHYENTGWLLCGGYVNRTKKLNIKQLETKYEKFLNKAEKQKIKLKEKAAKTKEWDQLLVEVKKRDNNKCRLIKILTPEEIDILFDHSSLFLRKQLDGAHCIRRSKSKNLIYALDNVYLINRFSHSMLDLYRCPITGKEITRDEVNTWWVRIIGLEKYNNLLERI